MIRLLFVCVLAAFAGHTACGQALARAEDKFHTASSQYIEKKYDEALTTVKEGLRIKPDSEKLEALRKLLEQEKKKNQQQQQNQEKEKQDKDKQDQNQDQKDQQQKDQQDDAEEKKQNDKKQEEEEKKSDQEQKDAEPSKPEEEEQKNEEKPSPSQRLEELKMSEEKARMILEAMKNQEMQYLQQKKRKATQPRDRTRPDW